MVLGRVSGFRCLKLEDFFFQKHVHFSKLQELQESESKEGGGESPEGTERKGQEHSRDRTGREGQGRRFRLGEVTWGF